MTSIIEDFLFNRLRQEQRKPVRTWLRRLVHPAWLGSARRTTPVSHIYGYDRGQPVDRYYIESFLDQHRDDIRGRVLEVKDSTYTGRFGRGVTCSEIVDIDPNNPLATITADLSAADNISSEAYDCFIMTQTLQFIYDIDSAVQHIFRILRPGGVLLLTAPGIIRVEPGNGLIEDYWRLTPASARRIFGDTFGPANITLQSHGNVLSSIAFLMGLAREELSRAELDFNDPYYPVVVSVRAVRPAEGR